MFALAVIVLRFIPTHVGETNRPVTPKHANSGSSPRMWGKLSLRAAFVPPLRFIPTHVGETPVGAYVVVFPRRFIPTHVGETWYSTAFSISIWRFIPTHVGETYPPAV